MSRRFSIAGFSLPHMRRLFGSHSDDARRQLHDQVAAKYGYKSEDDRNAILGVVDRALLSGVPFTDLPTETWVHAAAAVELGLYGQQWLLNYSTVLEDAYSLEEELWPRARKLASGPTRAFLHGLVEGIPLFGRQPATDGSAYGTVSLERLRIFQPGLRDLAEVIAYRVKRKREPTEQETNVVEFTAELAAWVEAIMRAERDLFFGYG